MFNNLIESSSHLKEFKRRGSFLLFTTATYVVLFAIAGVASIYAYDAHLDKQTNQLEVLVFVPPAESDRTPASPIEKPHNGGGNEKARIPEREIAMLSVNHPEKPPVGVSTTPNKNEPLPPSGPVKFTGRDWNPEALGGPGSKGSGGGGGSTQPKQVVNIVEPPPPAEAKRQNPPRVVSKGVITSQAISLPKPVYSAIAKRMGIQGTVSVQVLVDETGSVISAKVISGSPFLTSEAHKAAMQARFSPTLLGDQPVKVSGVITYNFVLSR
jgi:periplasmic protein TonB